MSNRGFWIIKRKCLFSEAEKLLDIIRIVCVEPAGVVPTVLHNHSTQLSVEINTSRQVWIAKKIKIIAASVVATCSGHIYYIRHQNEYFFAPTDGLIIESIDIK